MRQRTNNQWIRSLLLNFVDNWVITSLPSFPHVLCNLSNPIQETFIRWRQITSFQSLVTSKLKRKEKLPTLSDGKIINVRISRIIIQRNDKIGEVTQNKTIKNFGETKQDKLKREILEHTSWLLFTTGSLKPLIRLNIG